MAQTKQEEQHPNYVSAPFQLTWICITSCIIFLLIYWPYVAYSPLESAPDLESFTPKKLVSFGAPTEVHAGMYIKDFASADVENGSLLVDALVWFIFDPMFISFDRVSKFSFANGTIIKPDEIEKRQAQATTRILDDRRMLARFDVRVEFSLPLQYDLFPIDDHYMPLILVNDFASPHQMSFRSLRENLVVTPSLEAFGWRQVDTDVRSGFRKHVAGQDIPEMTSYSPQVIFSMNYKRIGIRHILSILLPLALMFFVSLFAFSFDVEGPHGGQAFGFATGGITGMMTYYYVIQSMSPNISYFMISDYLYFLFLLLSFIVFLIVLFKVSVTARMKRWMLVLFHSVVITSTTYLFVFWLR